MNVRPPCRVQSGEARLDGFREVLSLQTQRKPWLCGVVGFLCALAVPVGAVWAQPGGEDGPPVHSRVHLVSEFEAVTPGMTAMLGLVFDLDDGWHSYADSWNDSGAPMSAVWSLPEGFTIGDPIWPAAHRFIQPGGILDHVYEHQAIILFPLAIDADVEVGTDAVISASLEWLVCDDNSCVPQFAETSITIPVHNATKIGEGARVIAKARTKMGRLATGSKADPVILSWQGDTLVAENLEGLGMAFVPGPGCVEPIDLLERGQSDTGRLELAFNFDDHPEGLVVGWIELIDKPGKRPLTTPERITLVRLHRGERPARLLGQPGGEAAPEQGPR